ncbi:MAG: T9SS type A sorting domain-containing protein [Ignavibacteriales bacterium]|nr:T9SS type A sorting domain-containing protein [Ignavibacteriales bacterium]
MKLRLSGCIISLFLCSYNLFAQHSDPTLRRLGVLDGNNIRISVYNDGQIAGFNNGVDVRGEWPIGSGQTYIGDAIPMIGLEFVDARGETLHPVIISRGPRNNQSNEKHPVYGYFWGFNPLSGFFNPSIQSIAKSNDSTTWPLTWADHPEYGSNIWNGFLGPNQFIPGLEMYYQMDDYWDDEFNYYFRADTTDSSRTGYGITVAVRYFQPAHPLFNDVLIKMFDITNTGTHNYEKVVFGGITGSMLGGDGDSQDDITFIDKQDNFVYSWDADGIGNSGQRVGVIGEVFLESPSNSVDGIDNDGDSHDPTSPVFVSSDFDERVYNVGEKVVLIDPITYERTVHTIQAAVETVYSMRKKFIIQAGITQFQEGHIAQMINGVTTPHFFSHNRIDDDLDGLIDENEAIDYDCLIRQQLPARKYKNYITGAGVNDAMIDEAHDEIGIASYNFFNISASPDMANDAILWDRMRPGRTDAIQNQPQDGDNIFASNYFSLGSRETKRIVTALIMGYSKDEISQKVLASRALWNSKFNIDSVLHSVAFTNVNNHRVLSGSETIEWSSTRSDGTVDIWYSPDFGEHWMLVEKSIPNIGSYQLETENLQDSPFGLFKLFIKDEQGSIYAFAQSHDVTLDAPTNGVPFIKILDQGFTKDDTVNTNELDIQILTADVETNLMTAEILYSADDGNTFSPVESFQIYSDTLPQTIGINLTALTNSNRLVIKVAVSDGNSSTQVVTDRFVKMSARDTVGISHREIVSGYAQIPWKVTIIDSSLLTGHDYYITFEDKDSTTTQYKKNLTVVDATLRYEVLSQHPLVPNTESSVFDGLSFYNEDILTTKDSIFSKWNNASVKKLTFVFKPFYWSSVGNGSNYNGYRLPNDYAVIFYPDTVDTSLADTLYPNTSSNRISAKPISYRIKNLTTGEFIKTVYFKTGTLNTVFNIYFKEDIYGVSRRTWRVEIYETTLNAPMPSGDTLYLFTQKGLSMFDTIHVFNVTTAVGDYPELPLAYKLKQNYPNPFNPSTVISYQLQVKSAVSLKVYDILGRAVATLVDEVQQAGEKSVDWNATNYSSGIYFYRLQAGSFVETKKLVLVR